MPAGFQSFDANGNLMTDITDRLTRVITEGSTNMSVGGSVWVPVSGMVDDGTWFVIITGGNSAIPGNGGFTAYQSSEFSGTSRYTVFRI